MPLNHKQLIDILKKDSGVNFIAFCTTPWHAISTRAALMKLQSDGVQLKGIILADKRDYKNPSPLIDNSAFSILNGIDYKNEIFAGIDFPHGKIRNLKRRLGVFSRFLSRSGSGRTIYVLNPMSVNSIFVSEIKKSLPGAKVISVITDEGLGSYMRNDYNWAVELAEVTGSKSAFLRSYLDRFLGRFYLLVSLCRTEIIDCRLLKENNACGFTENSDMVLFYKNATSGERLDPADYAHYEGAVIISAQLYHEANRIKNDADLSLYAEIITALKKEGKTVILKPHPRDKNLSRYDALGCCVEKNSSAALESIFDRLEKKPAAVIGFTSTGLITANVFCGVCGISLNRLLPGDDIENSLKNEFANFEKAFSDMVFIPEDINALLSFIKDIQS